MAYFVLEDFRRGLDTRKSVDTAPSGSLVQLDNAFVNSGGEIEKRKAFTKDTALSAALAAAASGYDGPFPTNSGAFAFAGASGAPSGFPATITGSLPISWSRLGASAKTVDRITSSDNYGDNHYLAVLFTDQTVEHYYGAVGSTLTHVVGPDERYVLVHGDKLYRAKANTLSFSATGDPTDLVGTGSGSIDISKQGSGVSELRGLGVYYDQLAVFGRTGAQLWLMDPDPLKNNFAQALGGVGLLSSKSVTPYSDGDVLLLATTGVRSLRARDSSNQASVTDIGSQIDPPVRGAVAANEDDALLAPALVEPLLGQFWLALGEHIYALSNFDAADVLAWSRYTLPDAGTPALSALRSMGVGRDRVAMVNKNHEAFIYGGADNASYDAAEVVVVTPYMDFSRPATFKQFTGLDVACDGTWTIEVAHDKENPVWETVATITGSTHTQGRIGLAGYSTHIAVRAKTTSASAAKLAQIIIHYYDTEAT